MPNAFSTRRLAAVTAALFLIMLAFLAGHRCTPARTRPRPRRRRRTSRRPSRRPLLPRTATDGRPAPAAVGPRAARVRAAQPVRAPARLLPPAPDVLIATLVLPPQAGHLVHRRLRLCAEPMQMVLATGLTSLYAIDWIGVTRETRTRRSPTTCRCHRRGREHAPRTRQPGGRLPGRLAGDYLCGAAPGEGQHPDARGRADRLPCRRPVIHESVEALATTTCSLSTGAWSPQGATCSGRVPARQLHPHPAARPRSAGSWQLLAYVRDTGHVERYRDFEDWFKHTQDIPGAVLSGLVEHLFSDNELIRGNLEVDGEPGRPGAHQLPVNLLAGATDHITPPTQFFALADAVSTPAERTRRPRRRAATSGCSWAPRRCATTGPS